MDGIGRVAHGARRRMMLRGFARYGGWPTACGAALGAALAAAARLGRFPSTGFPLLDNDGLGLVGAFILVLVASFAGVLAAGLWAWWTGPSTLSAAREVDRSLGLKDRLSNAMALGGAGPLVERDPFVVLAVGEGRSAAEAVSINAALPITAGRSWRAGGLALLGALVIAAVTPRGDRLALTSPRLVDGVSGPAAQPEASAIEAARAVEAFRAALTAETGSGQPEDPITRRRLDELAEIEEQLRSGRLDEAGAAKRLAATLESQADELERTAEGALEREDALQEALSGLARPEGRGLDAQTGIALERAVRAGNLEAARAETDRLLNNVESLSPEQRQELSSRLERLADDLAQLAESELASSRDDGQPDTLRPSRSEDDTDSRRSDSSDTPRQLSPEDTPVTRGREPDPPANPTGDSDTESGAGANPEQATGPGSPPGEERTPQQKARESLDQLGKAFREAARELQDAEQDAPTARPRSDADDPARSTVQSQDDRPETVESAETERKASDGSKGPERGSTPPREEPNAAGRVPNQEAPDAGDSGSNPQIDETKSTEPARGQRDSSRSTPSGPESPSPRKTQGQPGDQSPSAGSKHRQQRPSTTDQTRSTVADQPDQSNERSVSGSQKPSREESTRAKSDADADGEPRTSDQQPSGTSTTAREPGDQTNGRPAGAGQPRPMSDPQSAKSTDTSPKGVERSSGQESNQGQQANAREASTIPTGMPQQPGSDNTPVSRRQPVAGAEAREREAPNSADRPESPRGADAETVPGSIPEPTPQGIERVKQALDRLEQERRQGREDVRRAQDLREAAQQLLERATPEDRERMQRWSEALAKESSPPISPPQPRGQPTDPRSSQRDSAEDQYSSPRESADRSSPGTGDAAQSPQSIGDILRQAFRNAKPGPGTGHVSDTPGRTNQAPAFSTTDGPLFEPRGTEVIDARPEGGNHTRSARPVVLGDLLPAGDRPDSSMPAGGQLTDIVRSGGRAAERAIDDQTIPPRYDRLLRKYFQRVERAVAPNELARPEPSPEPASATPATP